METRHESVLFTETLESLHLQPGDVVVDATVGGAGHFTAMAEAIGQGGTIVGIDADADAIARGEKAIETMGKTAPTAHLVRGNFRDLGRMLDDLDIPCIDRALFDLGWSSFHLSAGRGFSFQKDEPLLMTYGEAEEGNSAADLVNTATEQELADILYSYGEERFARGIARTIVERRRKERILTTTELVDAIMAGTPAWYHHRRIHPATKTFQALRIATNDELGALRDGLTAAIERLTMGGRVAVISFHSIEDRIVKSTFKDVAYAGKGSVITRKPVVPSPSETARNPRARSAKLRVFERCAGSGVCITNSSPVHAYA